MSLAIFDLDNTLIAGDSDHLWGQFLVEHGIVDAEAYAEANEEFYRQYCQGTLDIDEFLQFALQPLSLHPAEQLHAWRAEFMEERIRPILLPAARQLIETHRSSGATLLVITATNRFITESITRFYGIDNLIATTPEFRDGRYTGMYLGTPCYREGKVTLLNAWLQETGQDLRGSWFYSDSHNDLPLLSVVDHPVAVDPDDTLAKVSRERGWPIISLRE
jgi:HAD superfamily hydrolase (TIGR01490 family)